MSYQFLQLSDTMLCERITHYTARIDSNQDLYICFFFYQIQTSWNPDTKWTGFL